MAVDTQQPALENEASNAIPDYLASPNAVFKDQGVLWRYGRAPDYSKTRKVWEEGKQSNHTAGSIEEMVENLVKNWEVEASFKTRLSDWRTIDHERYSFAMSGGPPQSGEHMLKVGTYNAIIGPNEYYSPANSDFASSHKTFKRMMPTFAWEVLEVYSGPPKVSFKWRHWGVMKNDYVGFNDKGEKIVAKAHGGPIDITGVTIAQVDDKIRLQALDTYMDPLDMFRQIAPHGVVNKTTMNRNVALEIAMDEPEVVKASVGPKAAPVAPTLSNIVADGATIGQHHNKDSGDHVHEPAPGDVLATHVSNSTGQPADAFVPHQGTKRTMDRSEQEDSTPSAARSAQNIVEHGAAKGADAQLCSPPSNAGVQDVRPRQGSESSSDHTWENVEHPDHEVRSRAAHAVNSSDVNGYEEDRLKPEAKYDESKATGTYDQIDEHLEKAPDIVHPHPKQTEQAVQPQPGEAVAVPADSQETKLTHEEMSRLLRGECPFLMNRE